MPVGDERTVPLGALFGGETRRCACGEQLNLRWVTVARTEQDEEGHYRQVTTAAWVCRDCRQLALF